LVTYVDRIPNELKLTIADNLGLDDINALARTSRALNCLLTPYMYLRAKNLRTRRGRPYFLLAIDGGYHTAVNQFIEAGTSVDMRDNEHYCLATSLHSCVERGDIATAQLLIHSGVNLSAVNRFGATALHYAVSMRPASDTMVRHLLDAGADVLAGPSGSVLYAAAKGGSTSIVKLLLQRGAHAVITRPDKPTPLHAAAWRGSAATIRLLLEAGANIEATDKSGETALMSAVYSGSADNVHELLQWGANIHATDNFGRTPLHLVILRRQTEAAAHRIIHRANHPDASYWSGCEACVPVCRFAEFNEPIIDLLLDAGADTMTPNNHTGSPLNLAEKYAKLAQPVHRR
jgi:ankyrin repeat protein